LGNFREIFNTLGRRFFERRGFSMKGIIATIIGFALVVALIIAVIVPIMDDAKATGGRANTTQTTIDTNINTLDNPIP